MNHPGEQVICLVANLRGTVDKTGCSLQFVTPLNCGWPQAGFVLGCVQLNSLLSPNATAAETRLLLMSRLLIAT